MHRLTGFITDVKLSLQDDLHLVIGVRVDQRRSLLKSVDSAADGLLGVILVGAGNIAEKGVLVGDQRRLEFGLDFRKVLESWFVGHGGGEW